MSEQFVTSTEHHGVLEIVIDRPRALNALSQEVLEQLRAEIERISGRPHIRAVLVTGAGQKAFVAGADVAQMSGMNAAQIASYAELGQRVMNALEHLSVPVIAAVQGFALGGGMELAMACDVIFASETAKFGQPEVNLGIIPGFGGTQRLAHRAGTGTARRLIFSGEIIDAHTALRLGIADEVVPAGELLERARAYAALVATKGPLAVAAAKRVLRESIGLPIDRGLTLEVQEFTRLFGSRDRSEGMTAFLEKRTAQFTGE